MRSQLLLVNLLTGECDINKPKMKIPKDLDTVEPIPFGGGTGLEVWSTVNAHIRETWVLCAVFLMPTPN